MSYLSLNRQSKNSNRSIFVALKIVIIMSVSLSISSCWKSESERLKEQLEVEKAKIELQALQKRKDDEERAILEENQRRESEKIASLKVVDDLEVGFRNSLLENGTKVLRLRNGGGIRANFTLKCFQANGASRQFNMSIGSGETEEIGYQQGWSGNFVTGESCKVYYGDKFRWSVDVD